LGNSGPIRSPPAGRQSTARNRHSAKSVAVPQNGPSGLSRLRGSGVRKDGLFVTLLLMFRRSLYAFILVVSVPMIWINAETYLHDVRLGMLETSVGLLQLGYLLAAVAIFIIAARTLLQIISQSHRASGRPDDSAVSSASLSNRMHQIRTGWRGAYARRPVSVIVLSLLIISIPFDLVFVASGGLPSFGLHDWIIVGIAELPFAFVALTALIKPRSDRHTVR